jgi:hypothetical protein
LHIDLFLHLDLSSRPSSRCGRRVAEHRR